MSDQSEYASSLSPSVVDNDDDATSVTPSTNPNPDTSAYRPGSQPVNPASSDEQNTSDQDRPARQSDPQHEAAGDGVGLENLVATGNSSYDTSVSSEATGNGSGTSGSGYLKEEDDGEEEDDDEEHSRDTGVVGEEDFSGSSSPREMLPTLTPTARPEAFAQGQGLPGYYVSPNPNLHHQSEWSAYVPVRQPQGLPSSHYSHVYGHSTFVPRHLPTEEPHLLRPPPPPQAHLGPLPPPPPGSSSFASQAQHLYPGSYSRWPIEGFHQPYPAAYYFGYPAARPPFSRYQEALPEPHHYSTSHPPQGYTHRVYISRSDQPSASRSSWDVPHVPSLGQPGPIAASDPFAFRGTRTPAPAPSAVEVPPPPMSPDRGPPIPGSSTEAWTAEEPQAPSPLHIIGEPSLFRTTSLYQMANSYRMTRMALPFERRPASAPSRTQAQLNIEGNLNDMLVDWSESERRCRRRLVQFERRQAGTELAVTFQKIDPEEYNPSNLVVSCIWWQQRNKYFITSVDCILLLELIIDQKFSVEEKNRIRRNLEGYRPETVFKNRQDSQEFFRLIMRFQPPRPRNIEKNVKVFEWSTLGDALKRIVGKYSASWALQGL